MKKIVSLAAMFACGLLVSSCGGGGLKILVAIDPPAWEMSINETKQFTAYSTGLNDSSVTWSVKEAGGGTITSGGLYTAPNTPGTYHVVARSNEDPSATASAQVLVHN